MTGDPGAKDEAAQHGSLSIRIGLGWVKSHSFTTGPLPGDALPPQADERDPQRPLPNRQGGQRTVIALDEAPEGYPASTRKRAGKYVPDPHGMLGDKHRIAA